MRWWQRRDVFIAVIPTESYGVTAAPATSPWSRLWDWLREWGRQRRVSTDHPMSAGVGSGSYWIDGRAFRGDAGS